MNEASRFGAFHLDAGERLLLRDGRPVPLPPKAFDLLCDLVRHAGHLRDKRQLMEALWPDTFVEEANLTYTVSALRKALGDSREAPIYIETVPTKGYRFVGELKPRGDDVSAPGAGRPAVRRLWPRLIRIAATVTVVLALLGGATRLANRPGPERGTEHAPGLTRLTFGPGLQTDPTLSPDGTFVAYASDRAGNFDIWMQAVSGGEPVQVTRDPAHDWQPAWSPDGQRIAFRSERDGGGLFVVSPTGGDERRLAAFGARPRWSPDGRRILFASTTFLYEAVYYATSLDGEQPINLTRWIHYGKFAWHPDGRHLTFIGCDQWSDWRLVLAKVDPATREVTVAAVDEAVQRRFTDLGLEVVPPMMHWSADARHAYVLARSRSVVNVWEIDVAEGPLRVTGGPRRVTTSTGRDTAMAVTTDGAKVAYATASGNQRIWLYRLDASGTGLVGPPRAVTAPEEHAAAVDLSPGGDVLGVLVERPGASEATKELRAVSVADGRSKTLAVFESKRGRDAFAPRWSPDGMRIAYRLTERAPDGRFQLSIHVVDRAGVDARVTSPVGAGTEVPYGWSADGQSLLVATSRFDAQPSTAILPLSGAPAAEKVARIISRHAHAAQYNQTMSPDGRWIAFNVVTLTDMRTSHLCVMRSAGGPWQTVTAATGWDDKPRWSPDGRILYFVSTRSGSANVWGVRFDGDRGAAIGLPFQLTDFAGPGEQMTLDRIETLEFGVGGGWLALPIVHSTGSIWMLERTAR